MAYFAIAFIAPNYRDYKNQWLKAYEPGTTTPKAMALDSAAATTVAKLQLNADGFLKSAGDALVIPYIDGAYDLWLFPTSAEADANDTSSAVRVADDINASGSGGELSQAYKFDTVAAYKASTIVFPVGKIINTLEYFTGNKGGASYLVIAGVGTDNDIDILKSDQVSQSIELITTVKSGICLSQLGVTATQTDNHTRVERASAMAVALGTFINPDMTGNCIFVNGVPTIAAPIACDRPIRKAVFEQTDDALSVLIFAAGMDFFHCHNFQCTYTTQLNAHLEPAICLLSNNHNCKFSNVHTEGGGYGIYSKDAGFFQTYEMCRFENTSIAQLRIDGPGTTININNCAGYNNKTALATACLWFIGVGEVNINTYETGQGNVSQLILSDSVFNLEITALHWENTEVWGAALNLSNTSANIRGIYMQNVKLPSGYTIPLVANFKSTVQIANITRRDHTPNGTLSLMSAAQADVMNNSDTVISLSGSIDLDNFDMTGSYDDVNGVNQAITSQQLMRIDAPKTKVFSVSNATPNTFINFPFNGSKPQFIEIELGGTSQGVTNIIDGSNAFITALSGGGETSAAQFIYRWVDAAGSLGTANKDIQIKCTYNKGWYAL